MLQLRSMLDATRQRQKAQVAALPDGRIWNLIKLPGWGVVGLTLLAWLCRGPHLLAWAVSTLTLLLALIPAGAVKGGIELITEPKHAQFGDVVNRLPNTTYLAVNIIQCHDLKAGDADGSADPYVTVTWDQTSRQSLPLIKP